MVALDQPDAQPEHETWMRLAFRQAQLAFDAGEVPVGAVIVSDQQVIGAGYNHPIQAGDPTAHAEIVAVRAAAETVDNYRLTEATVYVTVEPCLMCAGALIHARVKTLVYGTREPKAGAVRSAMRVLEHPSLNHRIEIVEGVLADESRELMQRFFRARRESSDLAVS